MGAKRALAGGKGRLAAKWVDLPYKDITAGHIKAEHRVKEKIPWGVSLGGITSVPVQIERMEAIRQLDDISISLVKNESFRDTSEHWGKSQNGLKML